MMNTKDYALIAQMFGALRRRANADPVTLDMVMVEYMRVAKMQNPKFKDNLFVRTVEKHESAIEPPRLPQTPTCRNELSNPIADRIDGYDRDDLGESPDF